MRLPELARALMPRFAEYVIKTPHAAESGRQRNRRNGKVGVIEQPFGGKQPVRLGDGSGRGSEVFDEKPPEVTVANSEPAGETLDAGLVERALGDFPQRARDGSGGAVPSGRARRAFGAASQTRPQTGSCGCRRRGIVSDIFFAWRRSGADRPTKDFGSAHADEKAPVEAGVAG